MINEGLEDVFKKQFKFYKANKPPPTLEKVLNVHQEEIKGFKCITENISAAEDPRTYLLGLENVSKWKIYSFETNTGLIIIKNPFTSFGQSYWIRKCLEEYSRKPNRTNIHPEVNIEDWWKECYRNSQCDKVLLKKMRWTTLGYHHNWNTKEYSEENKNVFPLDLAELCDIVANVLGYNNFKPQAAIVNYYHMDSTLSAHTDHSEINLDAPLFSFSFGQSAIFLIGGTNKSIEPTAIMLNSGDILVMCKEARLCYHAVPKILPNSACPWNSNNSNFRTENLISNHKFKYISNIRDIQENIIENQDEDVWRRFDDYINQSRININVRQVLHDGQISL